MADPWPLTPAEEEEESYKISKQEKSRITASPERAELCPFHNHHARPVCSFPFDLPKRNCPAKTDAAQLRTERKAG